MTNIVVVLLDSVCLLVCNFILVKNAKEFRDSKRAYPCFQALKLSMALPIVYSCVTLFTFTYSFVERMQDDMWYRVFYFYIVFGLLLGIVLILQEHQKKATGVVGILVFIVQIYTGYVLTSKANVFKMSGTSSLNIYRYGDGIGILLAYLGAILSFMAILSYLHYYKRRFK